MAHIETQMPTHPPQAPQGTYGIPGVEQNFGPAAAVQDEVQPQAQRNRTAGIGNFISRHRGKLTAAVIATLAITGGLVYEGVDNGERAGIELNKGDLGTGIAGAEDMTDKELASSLLKKSRTLAGRELNPDVCPEGMFAGGLYEASLIGAKGPDFPDDLHRRPVSPMETVESLLAANVEKDGVACDSVATLAAYAYVMNELYGTGATSVYSDGATLDEFLAILSVKPETSEVVAQELAVLMAERGKLNEEVVNGKLYRIIGVQSGDIVIPRLHEIDDINAAPGTMYEFKGGAIVDDSGVVIGDSDQTFYIDVATNQPFVRRTFGALETVQTTTTTSSTTTTTSPEGAGAQDGDSNDGTTGGGGTTGRNQGNGGTGGSAGPDGDNPEAGPGGETDSPGEGGETPTTGKPTRTTTPGTQPTRTTTPHTTPTTTPHTTPTTTPRTTTPTTTPTTSATTVPTTDPKGPEVTVTVPGGTVPK